MTFVNLVYLMFCISVFTVFISLINSIDFIAEDKYKSGFACYIVSLGFVEISKMRVEILDYLEHSQVFFNHQRDVNIAIWASALILSIFISQVVIFIRAYRSGESFCVSVYRFLHR